LGLIAALSDSAGGATAVTQTGGEVTVELLTGNA
jgi:hypothetical protein